MKDDYPHEFILEINSFGTELKSNLSCRVFLEEDGDKKE